MISRAQLFWVVLIVTMFVGVADAQERSRKRSNEAELSFPPTLAGGKEVVTETSSEFLKPIGTLNPGVVVAKTPPTVTFAFFPNQTYPGKPWSAWGDSITADGKYYASIGDHLAPAGNAFVFEFDSVTKKFRQLAEIHKILSLPDGHYSPGKIHGRLDLGADGWLYFATHRGSSRTTRDEFNYGGDWLMRCDPRTAKTEIVLHAPVPKHSIPCSVLDPKRMIFYGGTAPGEDSDKQTIQFFAYDINAKKLIYSGPDGPSRYMILARSTGRVYFNPEKDETMLMRFDLANPKAPERVPGSIGIRAATDETPQSIVYTVSEGQRGKESTLSAFHVATEKIENLGPASVGSQTYITTIDADSTGRFLYYAPGAHGGSEMDGTPVIQFDTRTRQKKVIAFLHPEFEKKYGVTLRGTFSSALAPKGDKLYITWNVSRGGRAWDSVALTMIEIPAAER